jgi:hypothetical protein
MFPWAENSTNPVVCASQNRLEKVIRSKTVAIGRIAERFDCMEMYLGKLTLVLRIPLG